MRSFRNSSAWNVRSPFARPACRSTLLEGFFNSLFAQRPEACGNKGESGRGFPTLLACCFAVNLDIRRSSEAFDQD